jgi:RimJ/RimL family protein N-acetyltransferase
MRRMALSFQTDRLLLRPIVMADADNLLALDSDPEVMRYINGGAPTTREVVERQTLPRMRAFYNQTPGFGYWAAEEASHRRFIGWFELRPNDEEAASTELGYRLQRWAWGHGYATEAGTALLRKGFSELGVERVWAQTMTVNTASRRVMEKLGLIYVRTFFGDWPDPIPGSEQGDVEYALTKAEWLHQQS